MKNKVNIIFVSSLLIFIITASLHLYNKNTLAYAVGSGGGRMSNVILMVPPGTPPVCAPCPVCGSYSVTLAPSSGLVNTLCVPSVNTPNTGAPITQASVGQKILGNWTATFPTAISTNWGTALQ